jgi:hypothetical protein
MTRRLAIVVAALSVVFVGLRPSTASAQGRPAGLGIVAGAGIAHSFNADLDFVASAWELGIRHGLSDTLSVEAVFGEWRHTETTTFDDAVIETPAGPGRVDRIEQRTGRTSDELLLNVLGRAHAARVEVAGGGGVGFVTLRRDFTQTITGCAGSSAGLCGQTNDSFSRVSAAVQGVGSVAVPVSPRVSVYGAARLTIVGRDAGSSGFRIVGGVEVAPF